MRIWYLSLLQEKQNKDSERNKITNTALFKIISFQDKSSDV